MVQRSITAILAILILATVLAFDDILLRPAIVIVSLIGLYEFYNAFKEKYNILKIPAYIFTIINFLILIVGELFVQDNLFLIAFVMINLMCFLFILLTLMVIKYKKYSVMSVIVTFFGYTYVVMLFSFLYLIAIKGNTLPNIDNILNINTLFYLFMLFAISWGADTGGYLVGMIFGKHKLCEKLSPKKTYEGAIGGILGSIIFGLMIVFIYNNVWINELTDFWIIKDALSVIYMIFIMVIFSIFAQIGDFVASSIKRYVGIKDYSNIMPGHGGILDRFDSQIFITPVFYLMILLLG